MSIRLPYKRILSFNDSTRNWEALGKYLNAKGDTASRPDATLIGVGSIYFDTDLNQPIWSDGTDWIDATGTVV